MKCMGVMTMIFNEIYSTYYKTVSAILDEAVDGKLTQNRISQIVEKNAFSESALTIPLNLQNKTWSLITDDFKTPLQNHPSMPFTTLQKRWLKSLMLDSRIQLFSPSMEGLEDIEPLYDDNTFYYFDKYSDGDCFTDKLYIENFKIILTALNDKKSIKIKFESKFGKRHTWICIPYKLEYSQKDDKFRLNVFADSTLKTINLGSVESCELLQEYLESQCKMPLSKERYIVMELKDGRNALERAMLHFSNLKKETVKIDDKNYRITLYYDNEDETEIVIRVLSFGPMVKVIEPESFVKQLKKRIEKQLKLRM